jgi:Flp pilus assembly protein TadG
MVEFAIAATVFLLLLFGTIEFGRALYMYHTVSNAARIGARWAMVRGSYSCSAAYPVNDCSASPSEIQTYVQSVVPIVDSGTLSVATAWSTGKLQGATCPAPPNPGPGTLTAGTNDQGHLVCVTVSHPFTFAVPLVSSVTWQLSSTAQMFISQ